MAVETADVVVVGTGFGGAIPAYYLATAGARVVLLERGARFRTEQFAHNLQLGKVPIVDVIIGDGIDVLAGNCVGGSSVVYFAASLRAPSFVFERTGTLGHRLWPATITRRSLDRWYDRAETILPVSRQSWNDVPYAAGVWAAACARAGHTCNPVPVAIDLTRCTNCNWMQNGCRFDAKRSMLLNYLPAAEASGAEIRPLHEVQSIGPATTAGFRYAISYRHVDPQSYEPLAEGVIEAKLVILAAGAMATPAILQRSAPLLGPMPPAVGRHFSSNGDRVTMGVLDEDKVRDLLGLERTPEVAYEGYAIGKGIGSMTFDWLDPTAPEFSRFSLQQIYFPPLTNMLSEDGTPGEPTWFGADKKALTSRWKSWLGVLAMTEDANEGVFGPPPATGGFTRLSTAIAVSPLRYKPAPETLRGWAAADAEVRAIIERDGLGTHRRWDGLAPAISAHPLSSCRLGDDPATSALDDRHELRGYRGLFVTDGSAVPTSLCVNPSLTIAALAERASALLLRRAHGYGLELRRHVPPPGRSERARRRHGRLRELR
jgi:choline dehydrogenase-like flavoprotein